MSPREKSFWWKIAYLVAIAVLLVGLYFVGTPATPGASDGSGARDGWPVAGAPGALSGRPVGLADGAFGLSRPSSTRSQ